MCEEFFDFSQPQKKKKEQMTEDDAKEEPLFSTALKPQNTERNNYVDEQDKTDDGILDTSNQPRMQTPEQNDTPTRQNVETKQEVDIRQEVETRKKDLKKFCWYLVGTYCPLSPKFLRNYKVVAKEIYRLIESVDTEHFSFAELDVRVHHILYGVALPERSANFTGGSAKFTGGSAKQTNSDNETSLPRIGGFLLESEEAQVSNKYSALAFCVPKISCELLQHMLKRGHYNRVPRISPSLAISETTRTVIQISYKDSVWVFSPTKTIKVRLFIGLVLVCMFLTFLLW